MINHNTRTYGKTKEISIKKLKELFQDQKLSYLSMILLFGSRAIETYSNQSDYDFAILGDSSNAPFGIQAKSWIDISMIMDVSEYDVDIVDLSSADKLIKDSIKENYIILKGNKDEISRLFS